MASSHHCTGVIAVIAMAPSPSPSLRGPLCRRCNAAVALVVMALSLLLRNHRHHRLADVVAVIAPVSSPSLRWHHHRHSAGIVTLVAFASLLCCDGVVAVGVMVSLPSLRWCCRPCRADIITVIVLASLPLLCWHCCRHRAGWRICHCWAGIGAIVAVALSPYE